MAGTAQRRVNYCIAHGWHTTSSAAPVDVSQDAPYFNACDEEEYLEPQCTVCLHREGQKERGVLS